MARRRALLNFTYKNRGQPFPHRCKSMFFFGCWAIAPVCSLDFSRLWIPKATKACNFVHFYLSTLRAKLEKMPSIPEEPEVPENEVERFTMPDFIKPLYDLDVIEGKEAVLKCKVAGLPYPTIVWFHNGKRIESTEDRKMTQCKCFKMD